MPAQEVLLSPGNPAAVSYYEKDLGQRFCVPAFRLVCLFQANGIIGKKLEGLKGRECHIPAEYAHDEIVGLLGLEENDKGHKLSQAIPLWRDKLGKGEGQLIALQLI